VEIVLTVVVVGILLVIFLRSELRRIENRLCGSDNTVGEFERLREAVPAERAAILELIESERERLRKAVTAEREAILEMISELISEMRRTENRLRGPDDITHDRKIDDEVSEECRSFQEHKDKLLEEKKALPGIDLWDIGTTSDWEAQLMTKAEALRNLIVYAVDNSPHSFDLEIRAREMAMTYHLAHALVAFATLRKDLGMKYADWCILKIELLGLMRKRGARLSKIVYAEERFREIEQERKALEAQLEARKRDVREAVLEDIRASGDATMRNSEAVLSHACALPATSCSEFVLRSTSW
jgi:hypothetical protein